jgi:hypothetical protein
MIQKTGPTTFIDHGPASAIHSRGRVGGSLVMPVPTPPITEAQRAARKENARRAHEAFRALHSDCECHYLYGNQPRPVNGWKPPHWR